MSILTVVVLSCAVCAQGDVEAKKKRLGELFKQMDQIQGEAQKLVKELSGGDPTQERALIEEMMARHAPGILEEADGALLEANERHGSMTLKTLALAQADFRSNDRDGNRVNDFWAADVSGLYRIEAGGGIKLIEQAFATADARPCVPLDKAGLLPKVAGRDATKLIAVGKPAPKTDYWFAAIPKAHDEKGVPESLDQGNGRHKHRFAACAYPAEYGKKGKRTFIIDESNLLFSKDTGGKAVEILPKDPAKEGWIRVD